MFEGKHIHFSPTDNKPLCSYSGKLCRQRRLNGFAFCIRHILEDKSAPFKQCSYVTRNNSQKCLNAIPSNQDRGYCHSHMQVIGIIPKTERKSKTQSSSAASKTDSSSSGFSSNGSEKSSSPTTKKDPGAVFRFEEDSSDITDVFSYKNGFTNSTLNGKGKGASKGKESVGSSPKNSKNSKNQIGFNCSTTTSGNFTTKKVTDKNRNVYTTIIPTGNGVGNNNKSPKHRNNNNRNGIGSSSNSSSSTLTHQQKSSSYAVHIGSSSLRAQKSETIQSEGKELNVLLLHDVEEIRQFEHLKTLKQLDKSNSSHVAGISSMSLSSSDEENSCDAKFKIFPRLSALSKEVTTSSTIPETVSSLSITLPKQNSLPSSASTAGDDRSPQNPCKREIRSSTTLPVPPLITRSNNGIIIKTEAFSPEGTGSEQDDCNEKSCDDDDTRREEEYDDNEIFPDDSHKHSNNKPTGINSPDRTTFKNNYAAATTTNNYSNDNNRNSIESRDLNNRHEFLAHVRNTFKSQYTSIKQACQVDKRCEQDQKQKFRDSLIRCVKIDSSVCAQVLVGNGSKFSTLSSSAPVKKEVVLDSRKNTDYYDDYEFFEGEGRLSITSATKACTAVVDQSSNSSNSRKYYSNGKKNNNNGDVKIKVEEGYSIKIEKGKATSKKNSSGKKNDSGPKSDVATSMNFAEEIDDKASKLTKRSDKRIIVQTAEEDLKPVLRNNPSKRRLKRADAIIRVCSEDSLMTRSSLSSLTESSKDASSSPILGNSELPLNGQLGKRRRFSSSELPRAVSVSELGLTLNGHHSPGLSSTFELDQANCSSSTDVGLLVIKQEKGIGINSKRGHSSTLHHHPTLNNPNPGGNNTALNGVHHHELHDILGNSSSSVASSHHNRGLETVLNSVGSSETAGTPDGVITDASFDSTFEHSTSSQPDCEFSEDDLEHSFELQIDPEIENQASRLLEDNVLTEADFTELFPDNRMSDHKFGRNELQELGMAALDFDVNDIDYSLFANIFPNFPRNSQPESISISNPF